MGSGEGEDIAPLDGETPVYNVINITPSSYYAARSAIELGLKALREKRTKLNDVVNLMQSLERGSATRDVLRRHGYALGDAANASDPVPVGQLDGIQMSSEDIWGVVLRIDDKIRGTEAALKEFTRSHS